MKSRFCSSAVTVAAAVAVKIINYFHFILGAIKARKAFQKPVPAQPARLFSYIFVAKSPNN